MSKGKSRMSAKEIRKAAHTFSNLRRDKVGSMMALALKGGEQVFAASGTIATVDGVPKSENPWPTYLTEFNSQLPWNGIEAAISERGPNGTRVPREHNVCAEAHLWLELKGRGKNPLSYTLVSFNADGGIASPCANCAQWVEKAFGQIYKETPTYEGRTRQRRV